MLKTLAYLAVNHFSLNGLLRICTLLLFRRWRFILLALLLIRCAMPLESVVIMSVTDSGGQGSESDEGANIRNPESAFSVHDYAC